MTLSAIISMYADASGEVVKDEYQTIGEDPTIDTDLVECTAILFSLCEERPTRDRMDREFDPRDNGLYRIRSGKIHFLAGIKFDASGRMTHAEIVRITRSTQARLSQHDIDIAKARNELFQKAVDP